LRTSPLTLALTPAHHPAAAWPSGDMGQVTSDGTGDTMVRDRLLSTHLRCFRFHFIHHCEPLEARLLFSGEAFVDLTTTTIAAEWGVASIHAPEVWAEGYTGRGVTVAVVDSGIAIAHPDLAGRLWTNANELPGNGRDDDGNGFVDDAGGWDFLDSDNHPDDPAGHGTHIAGIIVGGIAPPEDARNSGAGEALGVAPEARVMPIRVLDGNLRGANRDIAAGIRYAVDNGADIINLSIGGARNSDIRSAIEYASEHDVLVVAAAGNNRANTPSHPAVLSSSLDHVLSVAATRKSGEREPSSNLVGASGAIQVDAPGQAIRSTFVTARYGYQSGTSMAAPHVAGLAALLLSANPNLSAAELRTIIVDSADPPAAGSDSAGSVNAISALALAAQSPPRAVDEAAGQQSIVVSPRLSAESREPQLAPAPPASASPIVAKAPMPVTFAPRPGMLILPPAESVQVSQSSGAPAIYEPESTPKHVPRTADQKMVRSLRDAALLAYRPETGGSAMSWPLDEAEKPAVTNERKTHQPTITSSAAEPTAARPRPQGAAAKKTADP